MNLISFKDFLNEVHIVDSKTMNLFKNILRYAMKKCILKANSSDSILDRDLNFIDSLNDAFDGKKINNTHIIFDTELHDKTSYDNIRDVKNTDKVYIKNGSFCAGQQDRKVYRIITFYFKKGCSNNVDQYEEFEDVIENIFNHEMMHKEQYEPIVSRLERMGITDKGFNDIMYPYFHGKFHKQISYNKKTLKELDELILYLNYNNQSKEDDIYKVLDNNLNPNTKHEYELAKEFVYGYIEEGYTIYDIMLLLDKKPKKIDNILWDLDTENNIKQYIPDILENYIKGHDSLKHELDADASTIMLELSKIKKKEDVRKIIEKPTTNTPSATFNYYLKIFGVNDSYVIKDLKKRLGKYYVAFYSGVDKLAKKIN